MIIDYSYWRPSGALRGVTGVIRYLSHDPAKATSVAELAGLHGQGIGTALVFEDAAARAADGASAGAADGAFCLGHLRGLAVPHGRPVYVAVDEDVPDYAPTSTDPRAKLGPIAAYFDAFKHALGGEYETAGYGGYYLCERLAGAGICSRLWQTVGWSGGQIYEAAALFQSGVQVLGGQADLNFAGWRDWGQFRRETRIVVGADA